MEDVEEKKEIAEEAPKISHFTLRLSPELLERVNHAIHLLKFSKDDNYGFSKKKWINSLIEEKIIKEEKIIEEAAKNNPSMLKPKSKKISVSLLIEQRFEERIEKILNFRRQDNPNLTKNNWIVEGIKEKLDQK